MVEHTTDNRVTVVQFNPGGPKERIRKVSTMLLWLDTLRVKRIIKKDYKKGKRFTIIYFTDITTEQEIYYITKIRKFLRKKGIDYYVLHDVVYHEVKIGYYRKEDSGNE